MERFLGIPVLLMKPFPETLVLFSLELKGRP